MDGKSGEECGAEPEGQDGHQGASAWSLPAEETPAPAVCPGRTGLKDGVVSSVWDEREGLAMPAITMGQHMAGWLQWGRNTMQVAPGAFQQTWAPSWFQPQANYNLQVQGNRAGVPWPTGAMLPWSLHGPDTASLWARGICDRHNRIA